MDYKGILPEDIVNAFKKSVRSKKTPKENQVFYKTFLLLNSVLIKTGDISNQETEDLIAYRMKKELSSFTKKLKKITEGR